MSRYGILSSGSAKSHIGPEFGAGLPGMNLASSLAYLSSQERLMSARRDAVTTMSPATEVSTCFVTAASSYRNGIPVDRHFSGGRKAHGNYPLRHIAEVQVKTMLLVSEIG